MWWLDPGKELLNVLFNRILAPYVMNLDLNQVNYGIGQGQLTLRNLKLKKGALDKFQLPVDVLEGHLGKFTLSLHWMNLGNQPVEILVEDVYLLVVPSPQTSTDPDEDEARAQAAKTERLENAELLHHPFAAGITLAGFTAVSVNSNWEAAFIESTAGAIHKLAKLQSLALYFDTDSPSMSGLPTLESIKKFSSMISHKDDDGQHQYILKPVSGEGRIVVNHKIDSQTPRFDIQLLFEEIGVVLDDNQYRDAISLVDMYHVYLRKRQYGKYRPAEIEFTSNTARARLQYAATAILEGVREKNKKWTWQHFKERRDDRNAYVSLFQKKLLNPAFAGPDLLSLQSLEKKMAYEDIRFYRSIARSKLKKDAALRRKLEADKKQQQQPQKQGWGAWLWGSSTNDTAQEDPAFGGPMTEEQRQQLYDVLDFDEKAALVDSLQASRDSLKMRVTAKLNKGSFGLKTDPHGKNTEVMSVVFDVFRANFIQRPNNFESSISLNDFRVFDGTTEHSLYPQIVHVKTELPVDRNPGALANEGDESNPFFFVKFENSPLDERADNALTVRMRHMEIIYHKGYVEAVYKFFKPPSSQLESVEALLNVASQTLEGLRRETRAGLEYALQNHKTVDIQMDLNAPIIIIPEDVTTNDCKHLIIDAGHISIESDLVSKEAIHTIHQKRNQKYTDEDYKNLESLMYDKMSLRLQDAQFIIGDNLQSCRAALTSEAHDSLHLLERITVDLQIDKSIVPTAVNLAQFKVSGTLPSLQVNLSDTKYKSLMRLVDVCIPHFGEETDTLDFSPQAAPSASTFHLPPTFFGQSDNEYNVDDDDDDQHQDSDSRTALEEQFFEAEDGTSEHPELRQHIFELDFKVEKLRAMVSRSTADGVDKPLGNLHLEGFSLSFALAKYDMKVDINLSSVSMNVVQLSGHDIQFVSTPEIGPSIDKDLLRISYCRVQKDSPDFLTIAEGIDQSVDIKMSTLVFQAAPEPVLDLYDFIMTTFVPDSEPAMQPSSELQTTGSHGGKDVAPGDSDGKIRVVMKLEGIRVTLINESITLATLALSTADVTVLVRPKTLRVSGRLGNLTLTNDNQNYAILGDFNQLVSIDGKNFADFRYQTFDPEEDHYTGVKSSVYLNAASIKFHFVEQPLHDLYLFFSKLAKLKGLYDAATQVAVQRASEIERMQFEVSIKSPIVVFPSKSTSSSDTLVLRLGQIGARNNSEVLVNRISASLNGIQLASCLGRDGEKSTLKIIDDIDVSADIIQTSNIDRNQDTAYPDTQVAIKISDVKLHLTQTQYCLLMQLANEIPRVFIGAPEVESESGNPTMPSKMNTTENLLTGVDLQPELRSQSRQDWTTLDLVVSVNAVKLHLYDALAISEYQLKDHGIARFALNDNTLRFKLLSHGAGEAQVVLRSFTMSNTRPGNNKFREIIPAAQHNRNQFMLLYTMSGGPDSSSLAVLTVDSPQVIFAVDPVISLLEFFTSAFNINQPSPSSMEHVQSPNETQVVGPNQGGLEFRLDLHDVSISILENDADSESRAIRLYINQILFSQQGIIALSINRLGMSLMRMGRSAESVRFLDDVDLTFSIDNRSSSQQQMMNIEIASKPIVFRASYRDINLITSIVNKAVERYGDSQRSLVNQKQDTLPGGGSSSQDNEVAASSSRKSDTTRSQSTGKAKVLMSKELMKGSFDGFRLVLIGDLHEHPMLHLKVKPFIIGAQDWSGQLHATTTMTTAITYWNLTNSHWEPLIDPWTLTITVAKESPVGGLDLNLSARERLDLNISTTFVELALTTFNSWNQEGESVLQKPRGTYAPYRIRNQTGAPVFIWSDTDSTANTKDVDVVKILQDQSIDWRFDDWKTMREHVSSGQHNIGIQFVEKSWEQLRGIPVDREGEFVYSLRPRTEKYTSRLLCEVKVVDSTKIVTIRSTYKVENLTLYPIELMLVDDSGHPVYSLERIVPGKEFSLPIDAVTKNRVRIQPDQGLGYKWSAPIRWEDLISRKSFTIKCPHGDPREAAFRLQAWVQTDSTETSPSKYPKINLKLRAPLELENLLPYNLEYRIYDKNTDQNWKSYLRQGAIMPVHSVELGHFILLNVNLEETGNSIFYNSNGTFFLTFTLVFKPSEFTIINTDGHSDFDIENTLTLRDQSDRKLDLKLNYVRHPDSGGAFKVQIYAPYIVTNKSGFAFSVKSTRSSRTGSQDVAGDTRPDILSKSIPFLLSHSNKQGHEFMFKIADSAWSKPVSLEAPAAETELVVASQRQKADEYHIGLSWSEGLGKYKLTKVITLAPRFLIKNQLPDTVAFRQHGVSPRDRSSAEPGQRCAFQILRSGDEKLLTIAYPGLNARWSPPINIEDIGSVHFRLPRPGQITGHDLVRADIRIEGSTIFIFFGLATGGPPFVIENDSDYNLSFSQQHGQDAGRDQQPREPVGYTVNAHSAVPYAWDYPAARDKKILLAIGAARRVVDIMEIGDLMPFKFNDQQRVRAVSLDVRADGEKQILRITNYNPDRSLYKPRQRSNSLSVSRQDTMSSSAEAFEAITEEVSSDLTIVIDLAGVGISLINKRMVEVIYLVTDTIKFEYANSAIAQSVNLACGTLQIDNQLHEAIFPVILQPTPIAKESAGVGALPTVQASVIWLKDQEHGVLFIKYCSILLQALTIEADEDLLFAIYDLTQIKGASWEQGSADVLILNADGIPEPSTEIVGQDLYFEILELQPIKLSLSFMRTERVNSEEKLSIRNPLAVVVNALTMTVGNINDAPLEMNALAIKDMRLTMPELQSRIMYHYRQDILRQLYRILGSADFIGNPIGLFTNVSSGVADIFYEPFQGVIVHGNKELGIGIAKGAASFVKKTVFGVSDSVTKFTSSVGKGLSAATFDSEYQARRRMTQRRNKPRHAIYGVAAGGEAFASSVTSAMEGVFMKPLEGAESEGAFGFFKGVGKGLVGSAVTKPVVGVFDLASNVSEGIRNTTTVFDNPERDRMRLPRLVPSDGVLRPYSSREALGQSWMKDLNDGAYRREFYVAHINSPGADNVILLTASRVLSFWSKKLRLEWELPFTQIQGVTVEDTGIRFAHKAGKEQDKFAFIPDKASQSWFFNQVASVVKSFNARRRMDS
ncbi:hypothetical protein CVT25_001929 [Psilocybe cyanescens]|uniref:Vacuolar protein sorting-associated protein n=1 Tax=Psilocybe cyanescens TaxID=93625 RepID=A0A409WQK9_PSICY|nr:hypothetical protein CVT25_001929 [Psilocybe cyanescens]